MIRVLLYAGDKSKSLSDYLEGRGTFLVDSQYSTIEESFQHFQDAITDVDKTIYLLRNGVNAKTEMKYLSALLKDGVFFHPGEIVFIAPVGSKYEKAVDYFKTVMQQAGKQDFVIKRVAPHLSYSDIYSAIMGTTEDNIVVNTRRQLYRVERNSDTTEIFSEKNDLDLSVKPFSYDNLTMYKRSQENTVRLNSGVPVAEFPNTELKRFNDLSFSTISVQNNELAFNKVIVSGREKTGMSTWAVALAASAQSITGKQVCLLDFTNNGDIPVTCSKFNLKFQKRTMADLLQLKAVDENCITVCQPRNESENGVLFAFLNQLLRTHSTVFTDYILVLPVDRLRSAAMLIQPTLVLLTAVPLLNDIRALQEFSDLSDFTKLVIVLNELMGSYAKDSFMTQEDIKTMFLEKAALVKSVVFKDMNVGSGIYDKLTGGAF